MVLYCLFVNNEKQFGQKLYNCVNIMELFDWKKKNKKNYCSLLVTESICLKNIISDSKKELDIFRRQTKYRKHKYIHEYICLAVTHSVSPITGHQRQGSRDTWINSISCLSLYLQRNKRKTVFNYQRQIWTHLGHFKQIELELIPSECYNWTK